MKVYSGTFAGTGSALTLAIGFKPDFVKVYNISASAIPMIDWNSGMLGVSAIKQGAKQIALRSAAKLGAGAGIAQYSGGSKMATASTAILVKKAGGTYDYEGAPAGDVVPDGFTINETSAVNVNGQVCYFEAGLFD